MDLKPKLGPMGVMLRFRKHMGEMVECGRQWCEAFDAGDEQAMTALAELLAEIAAKTAEDQKLLAEMNKDGNKTT
jgi:hypothetical protein